MTRITPLDAFVFQHGDTALELLLHGPHDDGEIPGVTPDERAAMAAIEPRLRHTWVGMLSACRDAIWHEARGDKNAQAAMEKSWNRPKTIWQRRHVAMTLWHRRASLGVSLADWGQGHLQLWPWVWVDAEYHAAVDLKLNGLDHPALWTRNPRDKNGTYLLNPVVPQVGDAWTDLAAEVARRVWPIASLVRTAVR